MTRTPRFRLFVQALAVLAAAAISTTPGTVSAAAAKPSPKTSTGDVFPFKIHRKTLPNGLRVLVVPTDHPGVVSYYTVVRTGSRNEVEPGHSGFAHFFEHMMFRGTPRFPAEKYNDLLKSIGADSNAFTTDDWTCYHVTAAASALDSIVDIESDRFQNLQYEEAAFQKEARAVLGEYNKNASNPIRLLFERSRNEAFAAHTYKHTTMGFLKDIEDMPNQFAYSKQFFDRFYRPGNCIVLVVGDVKPERVFELAAAKYSAWKPGPAIPAIPVEPPQEAQKTVDVRWPSPTFPWMLITYKAPAFRADDRSIPALSLLGQLGFGETSPLYKKLVVDEQIVDVLSADAEPHRDPFIFEILVRLKSKDAKVLERVRTEIDKTIEELRTTEVDARRLADAKSATRYGVAMGLDTTDGIALTLASMLELTGDPDSLNTLYRTYNALGAAELREAARKTFVPAGRTLATLVEEAAK